MYMCVVPLRGCERGEGDVWYVGGVTVMCGMWEVVTVMCMWGGVRAMCGIYVGRVRVMCGMWEGEGDEWYEGG